MGCKSSKVKEIEIENGEIRKRSAKTKPIHVQEADETVTNKANAILVNNEKATSAKSRDSGIQEMEFDKSSELEGVITEYSDPNLIEDVENCERPDTPEISVVGRQFQAKSAVRERMKSRAILEELEAEGLIQGPKVERGGAAFEVSLEPLRALEPLAPIKKPPARLERLKSSKKLPTKEELEKKMEEAEERRQKLERKKSRLASQLARDKALAKQIESGADLEGSSDDEQPPTHRGRDVFKAADFDDQDSLASLEYPSLTPSSDSVKRSTDDFYAR